MKKLAAALLAATLLALPVQAAEADPSAAGEALQEDYGAFTEES